jgi:hypothetical protein
LLEDRDLSVSGNGGVSGRRPLPWSLSADLRESSVESRECNREERNSRAQNGML